MESRVLTNLVKVRMKLHQLGFSLFSCGHTGLFTDAENFLFQRLSSFVGILERDAFDNLANVWKLLRELRKLFLGLRTLELLLRKLIDLLLHLLHFSAVTFHDTVQMGTKIPVTLFVGLLLSV